jgi:hypothetical protein
MEFELGGSKFHVWSQDEAHGLTHSRTKFGMGMLVRRHHSRPCGSPSCPRRACPPVAHKLVPHENWWHSCSNPYCDVRSSRPHQSHPTSVATDGCKQKVLAKMKKELHRRSEQLRPRNVAPSAMPRRQGRSKKQQQPRK